jgi:hypothetical protein
VQELTHVRGRIARCRPVGVDHRDAVRRVRGQRLVQVGERLGEGAAPIGDAVLEDPVAVAD